MLAERVTAQQLKAAEFGLDIARFEFALAQAALLRTRPLAEGVRDESGRFEIIAPSGGRVLRVLQESSAIVSPGTPLLEIGDPTDLEVVIDVLSSDGARIAAGASVALEHWAGDEVPSLPAVVRLVEPSAFLKISALGVEEQRVNVIADLTDPPAQRPSLGDGFRVDARITVWEGPDVLAVPTGAIFSRGESWAAFVVSEGHARLRIVKIGHRSALHAEVLGGLAAGERVILHPTDRVRENVRVSLKDDDKAHARRDTR
jgi:HlyD family secretion protein